MTNVRDARISTDPLEVEPLVRAVTDPQVGGTALFVGVVRDHDEGRRVTSLSYSAHPSAQELLLVSAERVAAGHPDVRLAVVHRVGDLAIGDAAVVVAAGAAHRGDAFTAARELIDDVKATVPIWKHQVFSDGSEEWVGLP